jgi:hypothetical protein
MLREALGWENMSYVEACSGGQFGIRIDVISEGIAGAAASSGTIQPEVSDAKGRLNESIQPPSFIFPVNPLIPEQTGMPAILNL